MSYTFKYRRYQKPLNFFFVAIKHCIGHQWDSKQDLMTIHLSGGGLRTIRKWKECEIKLGKDFGSFMKEQAEKEAGQPLKVKV